VSDGSQPLHRGPDIAAAIECGNQARKLGDTFASAGMHEQCGRNMCRLSGRHLPDRSSQPVSPRVAHGAKSNEYTAQEVVTGWGEPTPAADERRDSTRHCAAGQPRGQRRHGSGHRRL
jgi:hypothetical protein